MFYDIYSKYELFDTEQVRYKEEIGVLKDELKQSEEARYELAAKYSNLRVRLIPFSNINLFKNCILTSENGFSAETLNK